MDLIQYDTDGAGMVKAKIVKIVDIVDITRLTIVTILESFLLAAFIPIISRTMVMPHNTTFSMNI
jgi:hypothetical protein